MKTMSINSPEDAILNKINLEEYKVAKIISLSPQGDSMYAILRLVPEYNDEDNSIVGNYYHVNEQDLVLSEVLIPTDLDITSYHGDLTKLLNRTVKVLFRGGRPVLAHVKYESLDGPRKISKDHINRARNITEQRSLNTLEAKAFLKALGYTDEEIRQTAGETIQSIRPDGFILKYGEVASWHKSTTRDGENEKSIASGSDKIVRGIPQTFLKEVLCHKPARILTAR